MTATRLPQTGKTTPSGGKPESDIRSNTTEATRLYQRGVAAARGGQKRVAAGLLTRSVQLDPNSEGAWLWLSGVLEDPHQIAFCLNAVLKLNPANERARKGLRWLEDRQLLQGAPKPSALLDIEVNEAPQQREAREQGESWWVNWRQLHRQMRRVSLLMWSVPVVLLTLALVIHQVFSLALTQTSPPPTMPTTMPATPMPAAVPMPIEPTATAAPEGTPAPTPVPTLLAQTTSIRESQMIDYINELGPIRKQLREAVENYRSATGRPGSTTIGHAAAAQNLRTNVEQALALLQEMRPPEELHTAHQDYINGLQLELEAIDAMVEFYGTYEMEYANVAASRFREANAHFDRALATFAMQLQQIRVNNAVSAHTLR